MAAPVGARDEIDARDIDRTQELCSQIGLLDRAANATMPEVRRAHLTSAEAKAAGEVMFERAYLMAPELRLGMIREDSGWADMFSAAWEVVWAMRRAEVQGGRADGEDHRP